ncbi:hybrid sensor histidine kinase/response regulator transcription factor [Arenibacter echinorum]|uniref:hybrid sensor histidine kinase/response regulator transcription factor n=1 Tax=Arenibacter echinorum TaxID=440515 RepID=UPI001475A7FE|nr:hybrid sensor histidine kinase/response regulator transcription factor [Arenibacter echinorum]
MKQYFFIGFFLILFTPVTSQWQLNQIAGDEGLSHQTVTSIIQDRSGYMWFGTYYGINKYDGYTMKQYNFAQSSYGLSSNVAHKLYEDNDGYMWAGTEAGLNRIAPDTGKIDVVLNNEVENRYVGKNILHQSNSGVFILATQKGIKFFKINNQGVLENEYFLDSYGDLALDNANLIPSINGQYWFLTPSAKVKLHQIEIYNGVNSPKLKITDTDYIQQLFDKGTVLDILEYPKNTIWVISNQLELLKIEMDNDLKVIESERILLQPTQRREFDVAHSTINMSVDKEGRIWIAGNKLFLNYDNESGEIIDYSTNNQLQSFVNTQDFREIFIDKSNILWLGTLNNGLYKMDLDNHTFYNSTELLSPKESLSLFNSPILSMCEDQNGDIWFGTQDGTIAVLDGNEMQKGFSKMLNLPSQYSYLNTIKETVGPRRLPEIKRLMRGKDGAIWVGAMNGLSKIDYNRQSRSFKIKTFDSIKDGSRNIYDNRVFAIEEDSKGDIWFGSWTNGLFKLSYNNQNGSYKTVNYKSSPKDTCSLTNNNIRDILEDDQGTIWVGTTNGLNRLKRSDTGNITFDRFQSDISNANSLSNDYVLDIFQAKDGSLYIGTYGGGLNRINYVDNSDLEFRQYSIENGLPSDVVYQIREDFEGNIWSMHIREISKLDPHTGIITYFEKKDGFNVEGFMDSSMEFTSSGTMICGGVNGFTFFHPNRITVNNREPQLAITDFKIFNESVTPNDVIEGNIILKEGINETEKIILPHHLNSFEFEFSSMHFSNPKKNKFKFILEGFDEKMQTSIGEERRFAAYTNVPAGNYTFKVYGSNSSGVWSTTPKEILITITPPWYATSVSILFFIVMAIVITYIIVNVRGNQIKLKNELKLESALHEKSAEINQMKLRFFTNISHELRTPLTLIIGPLQQIMQGSTDIQYLQRLNGIMYKNSTRLLRLINQLLDFRRAESGEINLVVEEGNLVTFVEEIYNAFEEIAIERHIEFTFKTEERTIDAWFDNDKIEKILYNLLSNAFKFTPPNRKIELILKKEIRDNRENAIIQVIDEGIGIANDELLNIFERFYQAKEESNVIQSGSGLGLAYSKHLTEIHKGSISISSALEKGTTCGISIPISKTVYEVDSILESQPKQYNFKFIKNEIKDFKSTIIPRPDTMDRVEHTKETATILIVEDNLDLREYLSNYFQNYYKVLSAPNGEEGLKIALEMGPDIIISDLMMPIMNGIEMCKLIKNDLNTSHIPVIILTAKAGLENEKEGLETGADEFVLKPFSIEVLRLRVNNILQTKQQWVEKFRTKSTSSSWKELSSKLDKEFLKKSLKIIKQNIDNPDYSVEKFSLEMGMSRSALFKKIKSITGQSTSEFIRTIRIKRASNLMKSGEYSITEVVFMVGFSDPKYFRTCFKKQFGKTPGNYIKTFRAKT